jgi:hypothetical protein
VADQSTCGQGLAEHSVIPAKLGELTASIAKVLEVHTDALDLEDENAKQERAVYLTLAQEHRRMADELEEIAAKMASYRDLPMAKHDQNAMSSPKVVGAFDDFVTAEQQLLALFEERIEQDRQMLVAMRGAAEAG